MKRLPRPAAVLASLALLSIAGPGSGHRLGAQATAEAPRARPGRVLGKPRALDVPGEYRTIQSAVDGARTGDTIRVGPGRYPESVVVRTDSIVLTGAGLGATILDGERTRAVGLLIQARAVQVEKLILRNYLDTGLRVDNARQIRIAGVASYNNAAYGIALSGASDVDVSSSYVRGAASAGVLVEGCDPCRVDLRGLTAEHNAIGLLARNSGSELRVLEGTWRYNRAGIVLLSDPAVGEGDQHDAELRANLVYGNHSRTAVGSASTAFAWGNGIVIAGGRRNRVENNHVAYHAGHGILIAPVGPGGALGRDGNQVRGNVMAKSGRGDIGIGGPVADAPCIGGQSGAAKLIPRMIACDAPLLRLAAQDRVPVLSAAIRRRRFAAAAYPDWTAQPEPDSVILTRVLAGTLAVGVPAIADSILREARSRPGPPIHVSPLGVRLASLQSWAPLSPTVILLLLVLLAGWAAAARLTASPGPRRVLQATWWFGLVASLGYVSLGFAVAASFSAM